MDKSGIVSELVKEGISDEGFLSEELMTLTKASSPLFCVDAVLVPESDKPSVILVYRDKTNFASPNQHWVMGGRVKKGQRMLSALKDKIKKEIGINLEVNKEDFLFIEDGIHLKDEKGDFLIVDSLPPSIPQEEIYHTPMACYLARTPPFEEIQDSLKAGNKNSSFKLFEKIEDNFHPYIKKAIQMAWKRAGYLKENK